MELTVKSDVGASNGVYGMLASVNATVALLVTPLILYAYS